MFLVQNCIAIKMNCYVYCQLQLPWKFLDMYKPIEGVSSLSYSCNIGMVCSFIFYHNKTYNFDGMWPEGSDFGDTLFRY